METSKELIQALKNSIIAWYPFEMNKDITYIGEEDPIYYMLREKNPEHVNRVSIHDKIEGKSDYVLCIRYAEELEDVPSFLLNLKEQIKPGGRLILGMNNRFGIKNFCGDRDPYTDRNFDGIEDYFRAYASVDDKFTGRTYDKSQLVDMLTAAGFSDNKFYSVFSDLDNASFIFADGYIPNEELQIRIFPTYNCASTVFLEEERLYSSLLKNGMFHKMANAFLIECSLDGSHTDALQVTSSFDRGHEDALITIIHDNDTVTKQAPFHAGEEKLKRLDANMKYLAERGVNVVPGSYKDGVYTMPFIIAETGMVYLQRLLLEDKDLFLQKMDEFRDEILKVSEIFEGAYVPMEPPNESEEQRTKRLKKKKEIWELEPQLLLKKAMVDMIPLNTFYVDGKFVFFDQEFCLENFPVKALMYRVLGTVHTGSPSFQRVLSRDDLFARYGIDSRDLNRYNYITRVANDWLFYVRKEDELSDYYKKVRKDYQIVHANRQRMNFSADDYQRLFVDIFENTDNRKVILFGSGAFARRFMALYGQDYQIYAVVDNNEKRWGQKLYPEGYEPVRDERKETYEGVEIFSPGLFNDLRHGEYKVIICIKSFMSVVKQLENMGIREYSIFDPSKAYSRKRHPLTLESVESYNNSTVTKDGGKKYHVGYIAGVFDLYHIGHLNMFRRAKEMCDYLIVGVVSDEGVRHVKRTDPFVPFEERIEMVRSCRYVDEAVEIPYMFNGTEDAWKMHHFDVQFSGTDYVNDPGFENFKKFLEKHGATLEFFPYTESTSSTKLKELIDKKLI
ncbi:adenylyltransferase/cytidyltransferase family protein [Butyrivibrio sp. CB08]|uniref:adenylyltransferase/cytidyltransferase family protein n=1 Tax=Butyrivibrio sp. CB08 TaxID=2364879 RepID=UPI001FAA9F3C|nr:adenylyltransferase/cytidyltransferase family protein [Butyrivibrio sp. CB08]